MKLRRIFAIFKKQILDTSQNTGVIFSFDTDVRIT